MHDRRFRFGVACSKGRLAARSSPSSRARPRRSATRRSSCPTTSSSTTSRRRSRSRTRPRSPTRCASARSCSATTTSTRSCCAREMATLDLLSDGRLELGIGAGWMTADYEKAGIPLDRPGVRIARLAESITIMKGLFADGPFTFHGEHYRVTELDGMPKPVQQPARRSSSAAAAPKILALAAREAQIVGINANLRSGDGNSPDAAQSLTPAATDQKLGWVRDAAGDRLRRPRDPDARRVRARHRRRDAASSKASRARSACRSTTRCSRRRASSAREDEIVDARSRSGASAGRCRTTWSTTTRSTRSRRSSRGSRESRETDDEAVPVRRAGLAGGLGARSGATRRASSKTSGTRRCSCPTTSATELAPLPAIAMAAAHTTTLRVGVARVRQRLQAPRDPRQGGRDDRPAVRRPARARHRRGLDEDRLRPARPAVRPARGARRPVRGGAARHQAVLHRRAVHAITASTTASPTTRRAPSPCSSRVRRS